jgi:hypothetical protein
MQTFAADTGIAPIATQALAILVVAPCGGFPDVATGSPFCANVEWLGNRSITQGCTVGSYCPEATVSRLAMAAFMNRLGTALTPRTTLLDAAPGALDPDLAPVVCTTPALPLATFPRLAEVAFTFAARGAGSMGYRVTPVMSLNGGTDWGDLNASAGYGSPNSTAWKATAGAGSIWVGAAESVRFGLRVIREAGSADIADSTCQILVRLHNRDAAGIPHDVAH